MYHEKIFKRDDGSKVKVTVRLGITPVGGGVWWEYNTYRCEKGKRSWFSHINHDEYGWRKLDSEGRRLEDRRRALLLASVEEIEETMRELIGLIQPVV
jgi:hypothetical protein